MAGDRRPILRSERVYLRPAERADISLLAEWMNDADVTETLGVRGSINEVAEETWFEELQKAQGTTRWHFVICLRQSERPSGSSRSIRSTASTGRQSWASASVNLSSGARATAPRPRR